MMTRSVLALTAALFLTAPLTAQTSVIDEGSFRLDVRGSTVGTETFTIRRSGAGANATVIAQGRVVLNTGQRTRTVLQFRGPARRPSAYQIEVAGDDRQNITGRATGNRFRATVVSSAGEQMREYLVDQSAVIVDDGMAHQHFFIADAMDGSGSIPVIVPRQNQQSSASVQDHGADSIQVAGSQVSARRLSIDIPGMDPRTVWVDSHNRVLQARIPAQDLLAVRTSLP